MLGRRGWWVAIGFLLLLESGCSGGGRLQEFQQIAAIGVDYTRAVDGALVRTGQLKIQANSLEMLGNRELTEISRQDFEKQDAALREFLVELTLLRQQVLGLGDYFLALGALAGSNAPGQLADGLNQSASSLGAISGTLNKQMGSGSFANVGNTMAAGAAVGEIAIKKRRMRDLQRELTERHQIVDGILDLQEQLLGVFFEVAKESQDFVGQTAYEAKVTGPFIGSTSPLPCVPLWLSDREAGLLAGPLTEQLDLVIRANRSLQVTWQKLLSDEIEVLEFPALAKAVADALAGPVGIPASAPPAYWNCPQILTTKGDEE
jgi:hypothetical protein